MFEEKLSQIGFTEREARIYLELLRVGPQAVSIIAKRVGLNRSTTYSILKNLEQKGVVASYKNGNIMFFVPNDPNSLVGYLDRKCRALDYYKEELLTVIPKFRSLSEYRNFKRPIVTYFEGVDGVENVLHDSLTTNGEFFSIMVPEKWLAAKVDDFMINYKQFQIYNNKMPRKIITPDMECSRVFFKDYKSEILFIEPGKMVFQNEMNIYDDKVLIFCLDKGNEYGVVIESKEIAAMQRGIFEMAWKGWKG